MKNTLPIVYNGGAYGTYLEWLLATLIDDNDIQLPFVTNGNHVGTSHLTRVGHNLDSLSGWHNYLQSSMEHPTVRFHPKTNKQEKLSDNLVEILENCERMVLIYPDRESELLCINRFMSKPWSSDRIFDGPLSRVDLQVIKDRWPIDTDQSLATIPRWIIREYLSYYLVPAWRDQVEWFLPDTWQHDRCLIVYVNELLHDVKNTLCRIQTFWGRDYRKDIATLLPYHEQQIKLQHDLCQDVLCEKIIQSLFDTQDYFDWQSLPLASESWIQWKLRHMGFEIQCHGLDLFPTNSGALRELIFNSET